MVTLDWRDGATARLEINGAMIECACWGPSPDKAPTLVLLHEGLGCVALWRDFPKQLAARTGFGVFAYSRPGHGQSDPVPLPRPLDYMQQHALTGLRPVLDTVGVREAVLLGHSDGASIAAVYGGGVEDHRVRGLILIAPHFFTEPAGLVSIAEIREIYASTNLREKMGRYHADPDNAFRGWNDAWLDPGFERWNIEDHIDYIRVPVLAIQGADDQYGSMAQLDAPNRSYAPVDVTLIPDCKHNPQFEQTEATLAAIADYCTRLEAIENTRIEIS